MKAGLWRYCGSTQAGPTIHPKASVERFLGMRGSRNARPVLHAVDNRRAPPSPVLTPGGPVGSVGCCHLGTQEVSVVATSEYRKCRLLPLGNTGSVGCCHFGTQEVSVVATWEYRKCRLLPLGTIVRGRLLSLGSIARGRLLPLGSIASSILWMSNS